MKLVHSLIAAAVVLLLATPAVADQGSLCMPTTGTVSGLQLSQNINAAAQALVTSNSGADEPANNCDEAPQAGQFWMDTTASPAILKIYDGTQWEVFGVMDAANGYWVPPVGGGAASIASASTTNLWSVPQSYVSITGTTTINQLGGTGAIIGQKKTIRFAGALQLTYNGTSLILPGAANITTAAGDTADVVSLGGNNVVVTNYQAANISFSTTGSGATVLATSPTIVTPTLTSPTMTTPALGTPASGVMTNVTGTASSLTAGASNALKSASTTVNVSSATAPTSGQVLTATGASAATWQTPASSNVSKQVFTANGTWTKGTVSTDAMVLIQGWGAGGSGGGAGSAVGGGGGGGGYNEIWVPASSLASTVSVTIGVGGASVSNGTGNAGTNTTFGSIFTAYGGGGGSAITNATGLGGGGGGRMSAGGNAVLDGSPGVGGNPQPTVASNAASNPSFAGGGAGGTGTSNIGQSFWGGGGGSGSNGATGGNSVWGGAGGGPGLTTGGGTSTFGGNGGGPSTAGTAPGGGGGGRPQNVGNSGAGARGELWVTVFN